MAFADELRGAGHVVHTPDLFAGRTFTTVADGVAHVQQLGFETMLARGAAQADGLPDELVYAGMSMGCMPAQKLAQTRPGARGLLLLYSAIPPGYFGAWPDGLPVQIHAKDADPEFVDEGDIDAARELEAQAGAQLFLYPGEQHLFADSSLADYDPDAAGLMTQRVLGFLDSTS